MRRGFTLIQLVVVLAAASSVIAAAWGAIAWHADTHFKRGEASKQGEWDKANREAEAAQRARERDVSEAIKEKEAQRMSAMDRAARHEANWREAVRASNRNEVALGVCPEPGATEPHGPIRAAGDPGSGALPPAVADAAPARGAGGGIRLTWQFVRDVDTAWTGLDGEPVSPLAAGGEGAAGAGTASPYTLEDVRDVAGENAIRCSQDRREFAALKAKAEAAAAAWDRGQR